MLSKFKIWIVISIAVLLLAGCNMTTVDKMYCLPERSQAHDDLQSVMNQKISGFEYSAPVSGENRQIVQMADLDGDGQDEYLLFAKGGTEKPLRIFIFTREDRQYRLADTIESGGSAFDQVEYVRMNNRAGYELVVGCQVSDQVLGSLSVYTMVDGQMELAMSSSYTEFRCTDLTRNGLNELFILRPGQTDSDSGIAELYSMDSGAVERSAEMSMSRPADKVKRIMLGKLNDGIPAVYVASDVDNSAIITDVFALVDGSFTNVSFSSESGTSVQTLRNYYVYADDIDADAVLELPSLVNAEPSADSAAKDQHVIRWFALQSDGSEVNKQFTYHNFVGGWYLELGEDYASRVSVQQLGNTYQFSLWNEEFTQSEKIFSIHVLTGQKREEQAAIDNRFILYRGETTIYCARLEVAADSLEINRQDLINGFHLILKDWNNGET